MKRPAVYFIVFSLLISFTIQNVFGGSVTLDTTFNGTGYRIQQINNDGAYSNSLAIRSDGMIVLGGYAVIPPSSALNGFAAMCVNPNGTLNTGFDTDGWVITFSSSNAGSNSVLIQPDGKIVLGGVRYSSVSHNDFTILRYNTDGTLDTGFDGDGVAVLPLGGSSMDVPNDMALQPDGKIVIAGNTLLANTQTSTIDVAIMRLNSNGSLDASFDGDGILLVRTEDTETAHAVVIQPDGKIITGGLMNSSGFQAWLLMRFNSNGTPDTSFGNNGVARIYNGTSTADISTMALQADGKILVAGYARFARLNSDGSLDSQIFNDGPGSSIQKILALGDGKIMIGTLGYSGFRIARYSSDGTLDPTFNGSGSVVTWIPGNDCALGSIAMQPDGRIVAGGSCVSAGIAKFAVYRFRESKTPFDFDGDGKTDISIYRPSSGEWWISNSSGGNITAPFGGSSAQITPGDFTGDGKTDIAFWRASSGEWFVLRSEDNSYYSFPFGTSGDIPTVGDFDGDGKFDAAIFRPSNATWYIRRSAGGTTIQQFGLNGDVPVPADYDGDGKADIAIYRPAQGRWWIQRSAAGVIAFQFGSSEDKPVPGDYTGDGKADVAFWRPSTGEWFILRSENNSFYSFAFGVSTDVPAPGDYDGDGKFDAAVFRPSNARWYVQRSTAGTLVQTFGQTGDRPVPNAFVP